MLNINPDTRMTPDHNVSVNNNSKETYLSVITTEDFGISTPKLKEAVNRTTIRCNRLPMSRTQMGFAS